MARLGGGDAAPAAKDEQFATSSIQSEAMGEDGRIRRKAFKAHEEEAYLGPPVLPIVTVDEVGEADITTGQKMLSAVSGSLLTSLIVTPLDVVRIRLQSQPRPQLPSIAPTNLAGTGAATGIGSGLHPNLGVTACCREVFFMGNSAECVAVDIGTTRPSIDASCAVEETQRKTFNSTLDAFRKISRNEGITTLWRGLSPTLVMTIPANIIYFTGYDWLRYNKMSPIQKVANDNYAPLVAGAAARIAAAFVVSPIEMFRTRMQASHGDSKTGHFRKTLTGIIEMTNKLGYSSLWRGLTLTLWRDVPFSGIYWWGYETIRGQLTDARERRRGPELERGRGDRGKPRTRSQSRENHTATFTDSFTAGALSGAVASLLTMPFDVGKTRQQIFKDRSPKIEGQVVKLAPEQMSMPGFLMHIFKTEGVAGLWQGWVARTLKVAPACAIMISSYEVGKRMSRSVNEKKREREIGTV